MPEYIENAKRIEDLADAESRNIRKNYDSIFRDFADRFKTWETLKSERYLC